MDKKLFVSQEISSFLHLIHIFIIYYKIKIPFKIEC